MEKGEKMIEIRNLKKSYGGKQAVKGMNLSIEKGCIFGFLGPNGAGKTTTISMMTGIVDPSEGDVLLNGFSISKEPVKAKYQFGLVPDSPDMFLMLTGIEYLNFMGDLYQVEKSIRDQRILDLAEKFEMKEALGSKIKGYSHGMRQKIILMSALVHEPPIWILDEPMTGLDPKSAHILKEMMRAHADKGNVVLFSTHVLDVAEKICDQIAIIDKGEVLYSGSIETMRETYPSDESLESIFLEMTNHES